MDGSLPTHTSTVPIRELETQITELAGHLNAANYRLLMLIAEFDRRNGWVDWATKSCAHWLNWRCGIALGAAREKVRVAHALASLPKIADAMRAGQLSYSKVRELSRVATAATEEYFLSIALHGTARHVEKLVRGYRRVQETEDTTREARQQASREVTYCFDEDGSLVLKGRLPAYAGALVLKALNAAMEDPVAFATADRQRVPRETSEDTQPTRAAQRADALATMAESFLAHGPKALAAGDRHQIVIHVDANTLRHDAPGRCEIEHGPALPVETVRRLACDASVVAMIENEDGDVLNVGRKTRIIPPALKRALRSRDQGCRFPGCCNKTFLDAHHVEHWANGGETKLSNLITLCRFHHRQVHEGRVIVQRLNDGAFRFVRPDGMSFDSIATGRTADWHELVTGNTKGRIHIDEHTAVTRWKGERMDYGLAVQVLWGREVRGRGVPRGT